MWIDYSQGIFAVELLAAAAMYCFLFKMRRAKKIRILAAILLTFGVSMLRIVDAYAAYDKLVLLILYYAVMFCVIVSDIWFVFDTTLFDALIAGVSAYTAQHCAYDILMLTTALLRIDMKSIYFTARHYVLEIIIYAVVYTAVYQIFGKKIKFISARLRKRTIWIVLSIGILGFTIVLNLLSSMQPAGMIRNICFTYDVIGTVFSLMVLFYMSRNHNLESDVEDLEQMLKMKKEYYEFSKENIELVNIRCHDIRQQLDYIKTSGETVLTNDIIGRIQKDINVYDAISKTGNDALDVVITEKSLYCEKHNIRMTCMADGERLNFIDAVDLYFIFGNIIQNAIEGVEKIDTVEKRIISLIVKANEKLLIIQAENYYSGQIQMENGLPVTTKEDKKKHGSGMKSIRMLIQKYRGEMTIKAKEDIFLLNIVIPIPCA